jgi:tyrosine phenol-lyase
MEAIAVGIEESVRDEQIRARIYQVRELGEELESLGVPIVEPIGGHAVFLDARRIYPHLPQERFPAQRLAAEIYLDSGTRTMERGIVSAGRDPETGEHRQPALELVRVTIPRRVYTAKHLHAVARSVADVMGRAQETGGLEMVFEPEYLRFFQARFRALPG